MPCPKCGFYWGLRTLPKLKAARFLAQSEGRRFDSKEARGYFPYIVKECPKCGHVEIEREKSPTYRELTGRSF